MNAAIADRFEIIDTATRMMWAVDTGDWELLASVLADKVVLDYTSYWGGEPQTSTAAETAATWSALFAPFEATQHLLGNHLVTVDGDRGVLTAVSQATHRLSDPFGPPLFTLGGTYRFALVRVAGRWKIEHVVFTATWADGNRNVLTLAMAEAAAEAGIGPAAGQ
jgi:hypothetical protein